MQLRKAGCGSRNIYREKVMGARANRRELNRMLGKLTLGDVVTVTRIDRLARSTFDLSGIVKRIVDAKAQFRSLAEPATVSVVPIEMYARKTDGTEELLGCATAFCDIWEGRKYLITNWHNVTGRDPQTGQAKNENALLPPFVRAYFLELIDDTFYRPLGTFPVDFPIQMDSPNNWFKHQDGQSIDIAAFCLDEDSRRYILPINNAVSVFNPVLRIGNELYILGFPHGLEPVGNFPIWKRGSIASEPRWQARQERCFWIDPATREGMSGSPVLARALSAEEMTLG